MKILLTSHYTLPHRGGIETIVDKLSSGLAAHGHIVFVVASRVEGQELFNMPNRQIIGVTAWDPLSRVGVHYPLFSPRILPIIYRIIKYVDIVHAQGMLYQNSVLSLVLGKIMNIPTVVTEHAGFVHYQRRIFNILQNIFVPILGSLSLRLSNKIIVPDLVVQKILEKRFPRLSSKIICIPPGVDTTLFHPLSLPEKQNIRHKLGFDERPKILFVGNFVPRKRIPLLLKALPAECDLILCGEGTPPPNLPPNVRVYPPLSHESLAKLYQAADLFVVPSSVETFAIAAYEAMACGLPVIMTEDLSHLTIKESGLVTFVKPDPQELRTTIRELLKDPIKLREIGQRSALWVRENYSWIAVISRHIELYQSIINREIH
jgi:glycosyltransferase involved in cell wall biosynthesis